MDIPKNALKKRNRKHTTYAIGDVIAVNNSGRITLPLKHIDAVDVFTEDNDVFIVEGCDFSVKNGNIVATALGPIAPVGARFEIVEVEEKALHLRLKQ